MTRLSNGRFAAVHNGRHTKLYGVWTAMLGRCRNHNCSAFKNYGGRGISVCPLWSQSFSSFRDWANKNGYKDGLTIDRINNNGDYEPSNCRWITRAEQNKNYRRNRFITYKGETLCLSDWANRYGINRTTIAWRIAAGKPLNEVFNKGDKRYGKH